MRRATVLATLLVGNLMTASMGLPLAGEEGKFSVSNIPPLLFTVVAAVFFFSRREAVDRRLAWFFLSFNVACFTSFIIFLLRFHWVPNFPVLFFQDAELLFCALLWWYGRESTAEFRRAVKIGILFSIPVLALYAWHDVSTHAPWLSFGMDDKSQAAVLLCAAAYILIRFFGGTLDRVIGVGLYVASYLTISRMPVFFLPAILLSLMRRSRYAAALTTLATCIVAYAVVVAGDAISDTFVVYGRLSSVEAITGSNSTSAHLLLLKTALQMKFSDPWAFLFGIGPGNFSKALTSFPVSVAEIQAIDPTLVNFARDGRAPLHSTPMQVLLDYNFVGFFFFVFYLLRAFRFLLRRRVLCDVAFLVGFVLASMFYSLHNKPYFYLIITSVALLLTQAAQPAEQPGRVSPGGELALTPAG